MNSSFNLPFGDLEPVTQEAIPSSQKRVMTVAELTAKIRSQLESTFPDKLTVEGELVNCKTYSSGHLYFTLKDSNTKNPAQIRCVMWKADLRTLRFKPEDGLRVVTHGHLNVYAPSGNYQIICKHLEPEGLGALQLAFDQLKQRLAAEGLFDQNRKRPLPALPRMIGVVTSLDGAVIRDIVQVLDRRYPNRHIVICPTRVQGNGAALEIAEAIKTVGKVAGVDVIIVGRGGGSIQDLWAFNEEVVVRALAVSPVPTISAVGHETDITIADFVADCRAPTPSAAAEIVVKRKDALVTEVNTLTSRIQSSSTLLLRLLESTVRKAESNPGYTRFPDRCALRSQHVSELAHQLRGSARTALKQREQNYQKLRLKLEALDVRHRISNFRIRLVAANNQLSPAIEACRHTADVQLRSLAAQIHSLSPLAVLGRGYAVCWNHNRTKIIRAANATHVGDQIRVTLARGELSCEVRKLTQKKNDQQPSSHDLDGSA
jgi:exodeoxyribonuclease VII large subunit